MNGIKIRFSVDSRDYHAYQHFGQAVDLNKPINFDDPNLPEKVQPFGNVECTAYTATYIGQNLTKKEYDIDELFSRTPHSSDGADPRDLFNEIIKKGFLIKGTNTYDKPFSSFWRADTGPMDAFDNCRAAMLLSQSPIAIGSWWYLEWIGLQSNSVMPIGVRPVSGHMYANKGWAFGTATPTNINGEPMFIIEWWGGHTMYMPRATFNEAMKPTGMQAWVLSTAEIDLLKTKTLLETLKDLLLNLLIVLRNMVKLKTAELPTPPIYVAPKPVEAQPEPSKYQWGNPIAVRHSIRVICDEYYLNWVAKDLICAVIEGESGFDTKVVNKNQNGSSDYGLCQINDYFWIGKDKPFTTPEEVLNDPEKSVRFLIKQYLAGHLNYWVAFSSGAYKKYLRG